ncbi:hypothetical protein C9J12_25465 [Photobacterium frigidiphilum]|uniref:Uncharacterized protein n=2 Tax=Photobacterium frigidiphilum TaxID=264736 RepID=A0A2T3J7X6_9GAMM|nr:hypothetical protein C9J12_25465 [Photobacterium frigidiphilum]
MWGYCEVIMNTVSLINAMNTPRCSHRQTSRLLLAKNRINKKLTMSRQYNVLCENDKVQLRAMGISQLVCDRVGAQRFYDYSELQLLEDSLNTVTEIPWSITLFNGGAWVNARFHRLVPALVFHITASGKYKLSLFSLNINRGDNRVMMDSYY